MYAVGNIQYYFINGISWDVRAGEVFQEMLRGVGRRRVNKKKSMFTSLVSLSNTLLQVRRGKRPMFTKLP